MQYGDGSGSPGVAAPTAPAARPPSTKKKKENL